MVTLVERRQSKLPGLWRWDCFSCPLNLLEICQTSKRVQQAVSNLLQVPTSWPRFPGETVWVVIKINGCNVPERKEADGCGHHFYISVCVRERAFS